MNRKIFRQTVNFDLDQSPKIHQIGDWVNYEGRVTMILEIEEFQMEGDSFLVTYIVQDMERAVSSREVFATPSLHEPTIFVSIYDKADKTINQLKAGRTYNHQGCVYKVLEFTHLEFQNDELSVGFTVKPISPIHPSKLKEKRLQYKREQVNFTVLNHPTEKQRS
ncbi:hypothetical protein [Priestia megaterium]